MDWSSLLAQIPKEAVPPLIGALVGSVLGGCFVLAGSITTQYLTHRFTRQREREKLLRDKAEELIHALYQHMDWVDAKCGAAWRQEEHDVPSPLERAHVIQHLYFPHLGQEFSAINTALGPYLDVLSTLSRHPRDNLMDQRAFARMFEEQKTDWQTKHRAYLTAIHRAEWAVVQVTPGLKHTPRPTTTIGPPEGW